MRSLCRGDIRTAKSDICESWCALRLTVTTDSYDDKVALPRLLVLGQTILRIENFILAGTNLAT